MVTKIKIATFFNSLFAETSFGEISPFTLIKQAFEREERKLFNFEKIYRAINSRAPKLLRASAKRVLLWF